MVFICTKVSHGSEIVFVYGAPPNANASATGLSEAMIEYWVSFATSLDPNDGKGISREQDLVKELVHDLSTEPKTPSFRSYVGAVYSSQPSEINI